MSEFHLPNTNSGERFSAGETKIPLGIYEQDGKLLVMNALGHHIAYLSVQLATDDDGYPTEDFFLTFEEVEPANRIDENTIFVPLSGYEED